MVQSRSSGVRENNHWGTVMGDLTREQFMYDRRIAAALAAVRAEFAKPWTTSELAALVNLSASRFEHIFAAQVGVSPSRFVLELRLAEAHRSLTESFLSVKEVCIRVGFRDRSYFNRAFKSEFGYAPSRARLKGGSAVLKTVALAIEVNK